VVKIEIHALKEVQRRRSTAPPLQKPTTTRISHRFFNVGCHSAVVFCIQ